MFANRAARVFARRIHPAAGLAAALLLGFACTATPGPSPTPTPSPSPTPDPNDMNTVGALAVFDDPDSEFSTSDVYDVDGDIIRIDTDRSLLIWAATGGEHETWTVDGNDLIGTQRYRVRFGSAGGVQRAYFTEVGPATVCDLRIGEIFGSLLIFSTTTPVPTD